MSRTAFHLSTVAPADSALALGFSGSIGNIDAYITRVNNIPMLTTEEEMSLARDLHERNDLYAAQRLILSHLRLVVSIARGFLGYGLPHADLIQEGNIGLMKAVRRFNPENGARLVSYAMHWIKAEIQEYVLRNSRMVRNVTTKAQRKLFFNLRKNKLSLNSMSPSEVDEMAKKLNVPRSDVVEMEVRLGGRDIALESTVDDDDTSFAPIHYLATNATERTEVLENGRITRLQSEGIKAALETLDPRSRKIVESRWLLDESQHCVTLKEMAVELGVSAERVRQIEEKAFKKMKTVLESWH